MRISDQNIDRIYISSQARSANYHMVENHYHNYYEIYYLQKGSCRFFINNNQYTLHTGDFLIVPPQEVHYNHYLSSCVRINIYFRLSDLSEGGRLFVPNLLDKYIPSHVIHVHSGFQALINTVLDEMLAEEKVNDANTYKMMSLLLKQLFLLFERHCSPSTYQENEDDEIIDAVHFIVDHYNLGITLDGLAKRANLSPTYFSKKFRHTTGMGMKEFLSYTRLKHASLELLSTKHSITEIAMNCGFSNSNYFKDAFRKMYGISPREYRNSRKTDYILEQALKREQSEAESETDTREAE